VRYYAYETLLESYQRELLQRCRKRLRRARLHLHSVEARILVKQRRNVKRNLSEAILRQVRDYGCMVVEVGPGAAVDRAAIIEAADGSRRGVAIAPLAVQRHRRIVVVRHTVVPFTNGQTSETAAIGEVHVDKDISVRIRPGERALF